MFKKNYKAIIYFRKLEFSDFWDRDFINLIKCQIATLRKWIANRDSWSLNSYPVMASKLNVEKSDMEMWANCIMGQVLAEEFWGIKHNTVPDLLEFLGQRK